MFICKHPPPGNQTISKIPAADKHYLRPCLLPLRQCMPWEKLQDESNRFRSVPKEISLCYLPLQNILALWLNVCFQTPTKTFSRKQNARYLGFRCQTFGIWWKQSCPTLQFIANWLLTFKKEFRLWHKQKEGCRTTLGNSATCDRWALWVSVGWNCKLLQWRDTASARMSGEREGKLLQWRVGGALMLQKVRQH